VGALASFLAECEKGSKGNARSTFKGDPAQSALLDSFLRCFDAAIALKQRADLRFGDLPERDPCNVLALLHQLAFGQSRLVVQNGDCASVAGMTVLDEGFVLLRDRGEWHVCDLAPSPQRARVRTEMFDRLTDLCNELTRAVQSHQADRLEVNRTVDTRSREMFQRYAESLITEPSVATHVQVAESSQPPSCDELRAILRQPRDLRRVQRLVSAMQGLPLLRLIDGDLLVLSSPEDGVSMSVPLGKSEVPPLITLHAGTIHGYACYRGTLPRELTFSDTRRDVERRLGRPETCQGGGEFFPYSARYWMGVSIDYQGKGLRDPDNRIASIICPLDERPTDAAPLFPHARPKLKFHLVATSPERAAGVDVEAMKQWDPAKAGETIPVIQDELFDENDIAGVYMMWPEPGSTKKGIGLTMTPGAAQRLRKITERNTGGTMAIVLNDKVLIAPRINGPIDAHIMIDLSSDALEQFRETSRLVQLAAGALADEPPTTKQATTNQATTNHAR
jgi:hypothetical protein